MSAAIDLLRERGVLSPLDAHFALTLGRLAGERDERVLLAAAMASRHVGHGHVCLDLARLVAEGVVDEEGGLVEVAWPRLAEWLAALRASACVASWGSDAASDPPSATRPLILDDTGRLYLQRYFAHQQTLAAGILCRAHPIEPGREIPRELLRALFPEAGDLPPQPTLFDRVAPDWQRVAAIAALDRRFTAISGGPGTGKTYTVVKILALLLEQALLAGERPPRLLLLAPTGKAAARLKQSVVSLAATLPLREEVRALLPAEASTIHRALGVRPGSRTRFRHDRDEPLLADVVLVDEASMVDLALMARLVDALARHARLILLGDKDQLASVEAGAVLGDICNTGGQREHSREFAARVAAVGGDRIPLSPSAPERAGLGDSVVHLTRSYRFSEHSDIAALASAVNDGDSERALEILETAGGGSALVEATPAASRAALLAAAARGYAPYLRETEPRTEVQLLDQYRVLCAHRRGADGVETVNREIEAELEQHGLLERSGAVEYRKRPLLITRNDYQAGLFNGDVGVVGAQRAAWFEAPGGKARVVPLSRLPEHETVFAMTVHKSQGSEFDEVAVVLPAEMSPVLSRELLYTAVSRARERVTIYAPREVLRQTIARRVERASGLRDLLWPPNDL